MKRPLSLKFSIALSFLLLSIVIVLGYSMLSVQLFHRGMDSVISSNMETALESYVDNSNEESRQQGTEFSGYFISHNWDQQPPLIKQVFNKPPAEPAQIYVKSDATWFSKPSVINFIIQLAIADENFFISKTIHRADVSVLVGRNARESRKLVLTLSITISLIVVFITWLVLRHVSQPVSRLTQWTRSLSPDQLKQDKPDFSYPELNEMATLIQDSLATVHSALEREQEFLRFTSHELRTPISVIRNNVELLHKLQSQPQQTTPDKQLQIIDRIDRASLTMQHLSETLLWLSREEPQSLDKQAFQLNQLIAQLVEEMRYLLNNKPVEVTLDTENIEIYQSQVAARIVIGNLISNAFQHSWEGHVSIQQVGTKIIIENHCKLFTEDTQNRSQGFGLGLRLTEQLCEKLGWQYQNDKHDHGHHVRLAISD